ncbi:MAG: alpha/beta hydrolase [Mogibacterium sp.]|nr:alpha/beta hydrolase [Mogibacterium sp.]
MENRINEARVHPAFRKAFASLPDTPLVTMETAQAAYEQNCELLKRYARPHDDISTVDRMIPGRLPEDPEVKVRILEKVGRTEKAPVVFYIHGGGMYLGNVENSEGGALMAIRATDCVAVMPEYRLSWQAPYPAAIKDCYAALCWTVEHAEELNIDPDKIIVYGVSAGGGLAAALSLLSRDLGYPKIAAQIPLQPMLDARCCTKSMQDITDLRAWNGPQNKLAWDMYLSGLEGEIPAYASPALADDFSGLPQTYFYIGELDPMRDEAITYAQKLMEAGVIVDFRVVGGVWHAFEAAFNPMVMECIGMTNSFIKSVFDE